MAFSQLRAMSGSVIQALAVESSLKLNTYCLLRTVAAERSDQRASRCIKMSKLGFANLVDERRRNIPKESGALANVTESFGMKAHQPCAC